MGYINITDIAFESSTDPVAAPFRLRIKQDCLKELGCELEWRFIYVGDPQNSRHDQVLDAITLDRLEYGPNEFEWEVPPPDYAKIPNEHDVFDSSIVVLLALVDNREFFRCSYLIAHEYVDPDLRENPPEETLWAQLQRRIRVDNPVIKIQPIAWEELAAPGAGEQGLQAVTDPALKSFDLLADN